VGGIVVHLGSTVVHLGRICSSAKAIRQCGFAASPFCSETVAGRTAAETVMGYRNALRPFGIRIKPGGTRCFGDNLGQVQNISMTTSPLKKRRTSMTWHMERWSQAIGVCRFGKVNGNDHPSDFVSKGNTVADSHHHMDSLAGTRTLAPRLQGMFSTKEGAEDTGSSPHANDIRVRGQGAGTAGGGGND
jgi:hypothetical protein